MKTDTQLVTIKAKSAKERYMRVRELLSRGYMVENLYDYDRTYKEFASNRKTRGKSSVFTGDCTITTYVAIMRRLQPCKS